MKSGSTSKEERWHNENETEVKVKLLGLPDISNGTANGTSFARLRHIGGVYRWIFEFTTSHTMTAYSLKIVTRWEENFLSRHTHKYNVSN